MDSVQGELLHQHASTWPATMPSAQGANAANEKENLLSDGGNKEKKPPEMSVAEKSPNINHPRRSSTTTIPEFGIYWCSPAAMITTFLLGLGSALSLHGYYSTLNGQRVGDANQQQTALRVGTTLAFIAQVSLVSSIDSAYIQTLWRALKNCSISIYGVDAGFAASSTLLSFLNMEMLSKLRLASFLALVRWCIPISSLITPAALNVDTVLQASAQMMNISTLQISQAGLYNDFAYSATRTNLFQKFLGPRTILTRLAVATSTIGQILPLAPPSTNATYEQSFYGPYVQCGDANQTVADHIDAADERQRAPTDPSIQQASNVTYYFAFVPDLSNISDLSSTSNIQITNLTDVNAALHASNQLWLKFPRYSDTDTDINMDINQTATPHHLTCVLHNASYHVNFTWTNGIQSLTVLNLILLDQIPYPLNPSNSAPDKNAMAYSAYMWALSSQLTGTMGFYTDISQNTTNNQIVANRTYSDIATDIEQTSLLGTSDLNAYFIKNHALGLPSPAAKPNASGGEQMFSPQRLQDMSLSRNRTLNTLIPELSSNLTLSLISNPLLSPGVPTNITTTVPVTIYTYHATNVLIAYSIAISLALAANILGLYAYWRNGVSHDSSFSSMVCTTRDIHLSKLNAHERLGALPLDARVGRTKMRFDVGEVVGSGGDGNGRGRWGFGVVE